MLGVLVAALLAGGCTVPGSSRLAGPPENLPPSLAYVTADVIGFTLFRTDDAPLEQLRLPARHEDWIGATAGVAIRELQIDRDAEPATLTFFDVRDRPALEDALRDDGWRARDWPLALDGPTPWSGPDGAAAAVADDALVIAASRDELERWMRMADEYAVPERRAMSEFAVDARERVPVSFVFRFDLLRTQLRRPFEDDPALLELARWATDSNMLIAMRDGWLGIAPPLDLDRDAVRVVGQAEWVPDLAPGIELEPVDLDVLQRLAPDIDVAVALHDPGQQLRELVRAITIGAGQYVTGQDVAEAEAVELLPVLDSLDGDAAVGWDRSARMLAARVEVDEPETVADDLDEAFSAAGVVGDATANDDGIDVAVTGLDQLAGTEPVSTRPGSVMRIRLATLETSPSDALDDELAAAGTPPRPPIAWLWRRGDGCVGDAAGWITWSEPDQLGLSVDLSLEGESDCPPSLAARTLESLGMPRSPSRLPSVKR